MRYDHSEVIQVSLYRSVLLNPNLPFFSFFFFRISKVGNTIPELFSPISKVGNIGTEQVIGEFPGKMLFQLFH
jgi:hypothetical protein